MHPPLTADSHPRCLAHISALVTCHADHAVLKFVGHCNAQKDALDACFKEEKAWKRQINFEKGKAEQARLVARKAAAAAAAAQAAAPG